MLEKIVNINPGSDYKHSTRSNKDALASRYVANYHAATTNDSVSLSPASEFLTGIHWQLKNFRNEKEKLYLTFLFDGFEFTTAIVMGDISVINNMDYSIKHIIEIYTGPAELSLDISSPLEYARNDKLEVKLKLPILRELFDSITASHSYDLLIDAEDYQTQKLFNAYENGLHREFNYVNKCLVSFLEKYLSLKVITNFNQKVEERHLLLKKIQLKKN